MWSGRSPTWRCATASSSSCSAPGRRRPRRSRSWCYATSLRCCAASIHGPAYSPRIVRCAGCSHGIAGRRSWYGPRRWCAGTGAWSADAGPTRPPPPAAPDLRRGAAVGRAARPRESTMATSVPTASWSFLAAGCRPARSGGCCAPTVLTRRRGAPRRAGGRCCASRLPGWWPAASSRSTRSSCGACRCCSSSNLVAGASTLPASPTIRRACGCPAGPEPVGQPQRAGNGVEVPVQDRDTKFTSAFDDAWRSTGTEVTCTPVQRPTPTPSPSVGSAPSAGGAWTSGSSSVPAACSRPATPSRALQPAPPAPRLGPCDAGPVGARRRDERAARGPAAPPRRPRWTDPRVRVPSMTPDFRHPTRVGRWAHTSSTGDQDGHSKQLAHARP